MRARRSTFAWRARAAGVAALGTIAAGCVSQPFDYGPFLDRMPHSILVLPPTSDSIEVNAPYGCLSTVTVPLAERGYYVFPVAVVDAFMKENGAPTPNDMRAVPLAKLREVFGADAVLYLHVKEWGTSYQVINSHTSVVVQGRLVDLQSGVTIWSGSYAAVHDSSQGQSNALAMLAGAIVSQIVHTATDAAHDLSVTAMPAWFWDARVGLLVGPRSPGFAQDQQVRRAQRAEAEAKSAKGP